jgi:hypothetical protein
MRALDRLEAFVREKLRGSSRRFLVDRDQPGIAFWAEAANHSRPAGLQKRGAN